MTLSGYDTRFTTETPAIKCHDNDRLSRLTYTRILNNYKEVIATKETETTAFQSFGCDSGNENLSLLISFNLRCWSAIYFCLF